MPFKCPGFEWTLAACLVCRAEIVLNLSFWRQSLSLLTLTCKAVGSELCHMQMFKLRLRICVSDTIVECMLDSFDCLYDLFSLIIQFWSMLWIFRMNVSTFLNFSLKSSSSRLNFRVKILFAEVVPK